MLTVGRFIVLDEAEGEGEGGAAMVDQILMTDNDEILPQVCPGAADSVSVTAATSTSPRGTDHEEDKDDIDHDHDNDNNEDGLSVVSPASSSTPSSETEDLPPQDLLFVFDWDDCLFPTTELRRWHAERQLNDVMMTDLRLYHAATLTPEQLQQLDDVERVAVEVITTARQLGQVAIITNSQNGWVKLSCQAVFPRLWAALEHVVVYSARSEHETAEQAQAIRLGWSQPQANFVTPGEWQQTWKQQAFCKHAVPVRAVLSFGDSPHDRSAVLALRPMFLSKTISSVLTIPTPTFTRYKHQWTMMLPHFKSLLHTSEGHDLVVQMLPNVV